jgi:hypothetical protein
MTTSIPSHPRLVAASIALALLAAAPASARPSARVPEPKEVLGFQPGDDYKLADYQTIVRYFRALDAASDRVQVREVGATAEGRQMIVAVISSEENLRRLPRLTEISRRLALAKGLDDAQARALAAEGKAVVWIDGGLHASEVAHAQHTPELAWRVATEESEEMRRIRRDVVLVLLPVMNPDGLDTVVRWYQRNLGTPYEVAPMVELYQKYVGHDNNRDWYMFNMPESRNVAKLLYEDYLPQIVYNHHQTAPFPARIMVPPYDDPLNPNIPALVTRGVNAVGAAISGRLDREGKPGAVSRSRFDMWWNGGMRTAPYFHNMVGILTETALWYYATPYDYDPAKLPKRFLDGTPTDQASVFYPSPWKGGRWRLRDAVEYMLTASMAVLDIGSQRRGEWLYDIYQMGRDAIVAGRAGAPFAYLIPPGQRDPGALAKLVDALRTGGVEVQRASAAFKAGDKEYAQGTIVVPMAQAFRAHAKDLLEVQTYPDRRRGAAGPPIPPYDSAGWTLPAQMGIDGAWADKPFTATLEAWTGPSVMPAQVSGSGDRFVIDAGTNDGFLAANRALKAGARVERATGAFSAGGRAFAAGSFVLSGPGAREAAEAVARERGVAVQAASGLDVATVALSPRRLGLYAPWVASMDEGWTRFVLEQQEFAYSTLRDADVRKGSLAARFDVIVLADSPKRALIEGWPAGRVPAEYAGGLGLEGALALKAFVEAGGTLVTLDSASDLAVELFPLGVTNVLAGVPRSDYFCPGSILRASVDTTQPLAWGLPKDIFVFVESGPAFGLAGEPDREGAPIPPLAPTGLPAPKIVARFAEKSVLHSGWLLGESRIAKKAALVEAPLGKGRVVLIGFRAQFRGQSLGTYKALFNALM